MQLVDHDIVGRQDGGFGGAPIEGGGIIDDGIAAGVGDLPGARIALPDVAVEHIFVALAGPCAGDVDGPVTGGGFAGHGGGMPVVEFSCDGGRGCKGGPHAEGGSAGVGHGAHAGVGGGSLRENGGAGQGSKEGEQAYGLHERTFRIFGAQYGELARGWQESREARVFPPVEKPGRNFP